jgi:hypothetical protein
MSAAMKVIDSLIEKELKNFNPETFDWSLVGRLITHFHDKIEIWWDAEKIKKYSGNEYSGNDFGALLICNCHENFEIWWDPDLIEWRDASDILLLEKYCGDYKEVWSKCPEYQLEKLKEIK